MSEQQHDHAQDAVACTCSQAGFPSSCYNCDAEASDIVNALRKLYSTHPICAQAANYIERKLRDMATPSEPLQCLRCGTVDAFGPAARSPAEDERPPYEDLRKTNVELMAKLRDARAQVENARGRLEKAAEALKILNGHDSNANLRHRYGERWWDAIESIECACRSFSSTVRDGK